MALSHWHYAQSSDCPAGVVLPHSDFEFDGTPGDDRIRATGLKDYIDVSQGGDDVVHARGGDDMIYFGAAFTGADYADGGKGTDTVTLDGDYSGGVELQADSLFKVEHLLLEGGSYVLTGTIAAAQGAGRLLVDGSTLTADQFLNYDVASSGDVAVVGGGGDDVLRASSVDGTVTLVGAVGEDTLIGGDGDVLLYGGMGADRIEMNGSGNIAQFNSLDSSAKAYDTVVNFAASGGRLELLFDSDTATSGVQHDFHFEKTADRTGNILFRYDAQLNETVVKIFTDADHNADVVIHLTGDVPLTPADFIFG